MTVRDTLNSALDEEMSVDQKKKKIYERRGEGEWTQTHLCLYIIWFVYTYD